MLRLLWSRQGLMTQHLHRISLSDTRLRSQLPPYIIGDKKRLFLLAKWSSRLAPYLRRPTRNGAVKGSREEEIFSCCIFSEHHLNSCIGQNNVRVEFADIWVVPRRDVSKKNACHNLQVKHKLCLLPYCISTVNMQLLFNSQTLFSKL